MIELAIVIAILSLLLLPLTNTLSQIQSKRKMEATQVALENAKEALINYAIQHKGCLPFAADFEGGMPDTGISGTNNHIDTGSIRQAVEPGAGYSGQRAGDIPWADLNLGGQGLDGNKQRLQYYVASSFTSPRQTRADNDNKASRIGCSARMRQGLETWQTATPYQQGDIIVAGDNLYVAASDIAENITPPTAPWQVFGPITTWSEIVQYQARSYITYRDRIYRALMNNAGISPLTSPSTWREIGLPNGLDVPAWQTHISESYQQGEIVSHNGTIFKATSLQASATVTPDNSAGWKAISLPKKILESRRGPVINVAPGNFSASQQNVFILVAAGAGRNETLNRVAFRDNNHMRCTSPTLCSTWGTLNDTDIDSVSFSLTGSAEAEINSQDTVLAVSYADYQTALLKSGLNAKAVGY